MKSTNNILFQLAFLTISALMVVAGACKKSDSPTPVLNIAETVSIIEGDGNPAIAVIPVTLSVSPEETVTIRWTTVDGTAKAGEDYVAQTDVTLTFAPGEISKNIEIVIIDDDEFEDEKFFYVTITHVRNALLGTGQCKVTIINDDDYIPGLIFSASIETTEGNESQKQLSIPVMLTGPAVNQAAFRYTTVDGTAKAGEDYSGVMEMEIIFLPGETVKNIEVLIIGDDIYEMDDVFYIYLSDLQNCSSENHIISVTILNDDTYTPELAADGYITPLFYPGMQLVWNDEFDGPGINPNFWTHETGAGGWGNNELQNYTTSSLNSFIEDGKLHIVATKLYSSYYSARIKTQNKKEFRYARIDIRAKMPFGQGIWPALWMLGANYPQVGWPRCGEIDIMEYLGHTQSRTYGSVHYFQSGHKYKTGVYQLSGNQGFNEMFHVFTIVWQENSIKWYVNYQQYYEITASEIPFEAFRLPHFFIFNVAVGGNWPGYPNETTQFPQTMEVDYIRVFQTP